MLAGAILQMSSRGGRMSFPAVGSYSAGKFALEGWSEGLAGELAPFGIRVLLVEPSRFRTQFNAAAQDKDYDKVTGVVRANLAEDGGVQGGDPARAAVAIHDMLESKDAPLRLPLGAEAVRNLTRVYQQDLDDVRKWAADLALPQQRTPRAASAERMEAASVLAERESLREVALRDQEQQQGRRQRYEDRGRQDHGVAGAAALGGLQSCQHRHHRNDGAALGEDQPEQEVVFTPR
jgi:hypothetical protein